jgi:hypothetical protein
VPVLAWAAEPVIHDRVVPMSWQFTAESVDLPAGESMGLIGGSLLFEVDRGWWLGPSVVGAATGQRGGLFVGGGELQRRFRIGPGEGRLGLFLGGGGGAAAPVGGGLMVRPALAWLAGDGPWQAGVSWAAVRFPGGDIASRQFGLVASWNGAFRHAGTSATGQPVVDRGRSGVGLDRLLGTVTQWRFTAPDASGAAVTRTIGLVGARLLTEGAAGPDGGRWVWGAETAGAAQGDASGYMEVLGLAGWDQPVGASGRLGVSARLALGMAGGGAVPTGGGGLAKASVGLWGEPRPGWTFGLDRGWTAATDTPLRGSRWQAFAGVSLEPAPGADGLRRGTVARTEWTATLQHYGGASRRDGSRRPLETIGVKVARYHGPILYATGQGHSAFAGGAGAYSIGLVGVGASTPATASGRRVGVEALVGAAGGGGLDTGGGALLQAVAWAGGSTGRDVEWRAGLGGVRSTGGRLSTPLVEFSVSRSFGKAAR